VVHPDRHTVCPAGEVGEIWVSGGNVADGYWNSPEQNKSVFGAFLKNTNEGPFLRTGDLGFIHEGELYITGRRKDLLIIRGRNIYPQDLEAAVMNCHAALRPGGTVAFSVEAEAEERIVIVQELRDAYRGALNEITDAIRATVFEECGALAHAVILVPRGAIPKTSSGKLQRNACRAAHLAGALNVLEESILDGAWLNRKMPADFEAPRTLAEKKLAAIWSAILHVEHIGVHDRFFELGGDSLAAAQCAAEVCSAFHLDEVSPDLFLLAPALDQMALAVSDPENLAALAAGIQPIQPAGDELPVFLVGPGLEARHLPPHFGPNQPVFGIAWPLLDQLTPPYTVEKIAAQCVTSLLRYRPQGPYLLAGWCAAGVVAFEMARQLEAAGKTNTSVVMLDVYNFFLPPMSWPKRALVRSYRWTRRLQFLGSRVRRHGLPALRDTVAWRIGLARQTAHRALIGRSQSIYDALDQALATYRPRPWSGRMVHIWATDRPRGRFADPEFGWGHLAPGGFSFHEVPGDHITMLRDPNVQAIARILTAELNRVTSETRELSRQQ
jgi:thioesterase domain-containing protein